MGTCGLRRGKLLFLFRSPDYYRDTIDQISSRARKWRLYDLTNGSHEAQPLYYCAAGGNPKRKRMASIAGFIASGIEHISVRGDSKSEAAFQVDTIVFSIGLHLPANCSSIF